MDLCYLIRSSSRFPQSRSHVVQRQLERQPLCKAWGSPGPCLAPPTVGQNPSEQGHSLAQGPQPLPRAPLVPR